MPKTSVVSATAAERARAGGGTRPSDAGPGALLRVRTLNRRLRRATPRAFAYTVARLWFSGLFYHRTLAGRRPRRLEFAPQELWPGDAERGAAIIGGEFGELGPSDRAPRIDWRPAGAGVGGLADLHGFDWLADLHAVGGEAARGCARRLIGNWIETQSAWRRTTWRADVVAARFVNWLTYAYFGFADVEGEPARALLDSLGRHARHLRRLLPLLDPGGDRLLVLRALIYASLSLAGERRRLDKWIEALEAELELHIAADGGHASRSPAVQLRIFRQLVDLRAALRDADAQVPAALQNAIDRMAPMVRFFRHGDGGLSLFNDSNEGENWLIDVALSRAEARGKPVEAAPHVGFQRLIANRTLVIVDAGPPPPSGFDEHAHAGALSFEMSVGRERLVVNCGAYAGSRGDWEIAQRTTAAHSMVSVDDLSSSEILPGRLIGRRLQRVAVRRNESAGNTWIDGHLDGYAGRRDLSLRRRLYLSASGGDLRGEDTLNASQGRKFAARFHLHPTVKASLVQDGETVLLRLGDGSGWRFRASGGATSLQDSVYLGARGHAKRSAQIVVSGASSSGGTQIKWAFTRLSGDS